MAQELKSEITKVKEDLLVHNNQNDPKNDETTSNLDLSAELKGKQKVRFRTQTDEIKAFTPNHQNRIEKAVSRNYNSLNISNLPNIEDLNDSMVSKIRKSSYMEHISKTIDFDEGIYHNEINQIDTVSSEEYNDDNEDEDEKEEERENYNENELEISRNLIKEERKIEIIQNENSENTYESFHSIPIQITKANSKIQNDLVDKPIQFAENIFEEFSVVIPEFEIQIENLTAKQKFIPAFALSNDLKCKERKILLLELVDQITSFNEDPLILKNQTNFVESIK